MAKNKFRHYPSPYGKHFNKDKTPVQILLIRIEQNQVLISRQVNKSIVLTNTNNDTMMKKWVWMQRILTEFNRKSL